MILVALLSEKWLQYLCPCQHMRPFLNIKCNATSIEKGIFQKHSRHVSLYFDVGRLNSWLARVVCNKVAKKLAFNNLFRYIFFNIFYISILIRFLSKRYNWQESKLWIYAEHARGQYLYLNQWWPSSLTHTVYRRLSVSSKCSTQMCKRQAEIYNSQRFIECEEILSTINNNSFRDHSLHKYRLTTYAITRSINIICLTS